MARSAYAAFVKAYSERHPGLRGPDLMRQAAHAWRAEKRATAKNPATPARLEQLKERLERAEERYRRQPTRRDLADETRAYHAYERATREERQNPEVELRPDELLLLYPTGLSEDVEIAIPAGVGVERIPESEARGMNPSRKVARSGRMREEPPPGYASCPNCGDTVPVRTVQRYGSCPTCGAKLKVKK